MLFMAKFSIQSHDYNLDFLHKSSKHGYFDSFFDVVLKRRLYYLSIKNIPAGCWSLAGGFKVRCTLRYTTGVGIMFSLRSQTYYPLLDFNQPHVFFEIYWLTKPSFVVKKSSQ